MLLFSEETSVKAWFGRVNVLYRFMGVILGWLGCLFVGVQQSIRLMVYYYGSVCVWLFLSRCDVVLLCYMYAVSRFHGYHYGGCLCEGWR